MADGAEDPATRNTDAPGDPLLGQVIEGRYRIDQLLGRGGMGSVYRAEHVLMQKQVAVKFLHAGLASDPEVVRRFKNEAVAASSIGHPGIVEVFDMLRLGDGTFLMVLEFLNGRDWQNELDESPVQPLPRVSHIAVQICEALGVAAARGIVHRDLKPENVFLIERQGDRDFVKVLDFGIAKILDGSNSSTRTGALMGTPYYMAPEQIQGSKDITHLADVYALGVILFQVLSGRVPFDGETLPQIILRIATEAPPSLHQCAPHLPDDVVELVMQMLEKDPKARPQTFEEVAARLRPHLPPDSRLRDGGAAVSPSWAARSSAALPRSAGKVVRPPWVVPVLLSGIVGLGAWMIWGGDEGAGKSPAHEAEGPPGTRDGASTAATEAAEPASDAVPQRASGGTQGADEPSGNPASSNSSTSSSNGSGSTKQPSKGSGSGSGAKPFKEIGRSVKRIFQ